MSYAFNIETLYEKTDNGLEIIKKYLGSCKGFDKALQNQKEAFHFRDNDDTASAYLISPYKVLKSSEVNYWRLKDHGDDFYTPIKIAMQFTGLDFYPCLKKLYEEFNLVQGKTFFQAETEVVTLEKTDKRKVGWFNIVYKKEHYDLKVIGRFVTDELAAKYFFKSVDYYEKVFIKKGTENLTYIKVTSTDSFPIFAYAPNKDWCKLYAPLSNDKQYKHGYLGTKPERYVHGLQHLRSEFEKKMLEFDKRISKCTDPFLKSDLQEEKANFKFDKCYGATGGSDGLNIASLGEFSIWLNSETEKLNFIEHNEILTYVKEFINIPDIDITGIKQAHELAEFFWNMRTIWLPKDKLGTKGKDFKDWMKFYNNSDLEIIKRQFSMLINGSLKIKFFDIDAKNKGVKIKPTYLHYFLKVKGFHLYYPEKQFTDKVADQEYIFIRVVDNIATQFFPNQIRKFCERYLIDKGQSTNVIDQIKTTVQFTDKNLLGLDDIVLDFRNYTVNSQTFFFKNLYANVTAEAIELKQYKYYNRFVWSDAILDTNVFLETPFFKHTNDDAGNDRVEIIRTDCDYMNFLINGSRVFWRKELEEPFAENQTEEKEKYHNENRFNLKANYLTEEQNLIQEKHFLNKCFSIGYLMHRQKRESFAKVLYIMDDLAKDSEDDANGRSGKSLMLNGVDRLLKKRFKIDGKNKNITTDKHILHGLTKENDYVYIEDLDQYVSLEFFYNWITGSVVVNPKNSKPYEIGFFDVGKLVVNSNFGIPKLTASTLGRLLFCSFSDYYHEKNDKYNERRKVSDDFGGNDLFSDYWNEKQWNIFYNFLLQCNQLYLQNLNREINAPQNNIDINNAKASMGDVFIEWCESYFTESITEPLNELQELITTAGTLNVYIARKEMQDNYNQFAGKYPKTANNFKKCLIQYCKTSNKGWIFNPKDLIGSDGTIKKPISNKSGGRDIVEHFYIRTIATPEVEQLQLEVKAPAKKPSDDLPI